MRMSEKKVVKTTVNLPEGAIEALQQIATDRGSTMSEVIRQAIATEKFLHDTAKSGGKVLIEEKDRKLKQLLVR
jgi:hypothetical protein